MRAQDNMGQIRQPFDVARRHIKPELPPVTPFILHTQNNLDHFSQSLSRPRHEGAGPKLINQATYLPFLPVQTTFFAKTSTDSSPPYEDTTHTYFASASIAFGVN